jgi:uroporphyrinogen-III decarboxylase
MKMYSRERILKTLSHKEPDRVPIFEIAITNQVAEYFLGEKVYIWGSGATTKQAIEIEMKDKHEYKKFMNNCFQNALEVYYKAGIDMIPIYPTAFVTPLNFGLHNVAISEIYDIEIKKESENLYKLISRDSFASDFWCSCMYSPISDTFQMYKDNIVEKGINEFRRYTDYLENKDLSSVPEQLSYGLEGLKNAIEVNNKKYDLSILGFADIEYPCFQTFHSMFLELMLTDGKLIHRYMRATTNSMLALLKIELEMGVDGILGANDWAYKNAPMMSPKNFDEFMAPYLKELIDLTHSYGKYYIKHLDGNTYPILDSLVNFCGIDAYHAIEPTAGMDIKKVKDMYGNKITVIGNIDCGEILVNWNPEKIKDEVERIIRLVSPGGGHIFGSSNAIHSGIPIENFLTYISAVKKYGNYPINN